ncbi:hypothetical protein ACFZCP_05915 [Streptomyces sp. NPDC007971]|uniref:hypothetical protein n=1 Tax=Streptomyces sp. NPDC007971 TaxID=3364799 RepID=UPI0036EDC5EF
MSCEKPRLLITGTTDIAATHRENVSMDQGIAGVIAGIAGLVGAGIGGLATAYGARIGAEKTIEAAQTQVDRQSAAEHTHWVREQRKEVYSAVVEGHVAILTTSQSLRELMDDGSALSAEQMASAKDGLAAFGCTIARTQLWGPDEVVRLAGALAYAAAHRFAKQVDWSAAIRRGDHGAIQERRQEFLHLAERETEARMTLVAATRGTLGTPAA